MVKVELVYITKEQQIVHQRLELKQGATVADALLVSGIYDSHPETEKMSVGIYAKQVTLDTELKDGDRVEIYRPLSLDPKENRRQRAQGKK
ncbi:RnfH family protein [Legionella rowbothamii]|uniref:RnfH family protein n=1 Tax=Legionella rowbothamii TaxID=96229 RepID=UPI001056BD60|nr:RnfH family protein [Legionella rowbothamii]